MGELAKLNDWAGGMNNISQADRLPDGQVRDLLNLDPVVGGELHRRAMETKVIEMTAVHGAVPYLDGFLVADGSSLVRVSCRHNEALLIASIPSAGGLCGAELNGDAFVCTATHSLRVRGDLVGEWGLPEIQPRVQLAAGAMPPGVYHVAVTGIDAFGGESGAFPLLVTLEQEGRIDLQWPIPTGAEECRVYASQANGETLYLQARVSVGAHSLERVVDDSARLTVGNLVQPPVASSVIAYKGRLLLVCHDVVWITEPFAPGLVNPLTGFVAYSDRVELVLPVDLGVYIATSSRTYFVTGIGTDQVQQRTLFGHGAVRGSGVVLPDGRATWMTRYGQAFGDAAGNVQLPQEKSFAPVIASQAVAGLIEGNGCQMAVVALRGTASPSTLGIQDTFDGEIDE